MTRSLVEMPPPEGKGTESAVMAVVDTVVNHDSQETSFTKEA